MGYSTPKPPFDLGEFLSQKATSRAIRRPTWQRRSASLPAVMPDEDEAADIVAPGSGAE